MYPLDPECYPSASGGDGAFSALEDLEGSQYKYIGELQTELEGKSGAIYRGRGVAFWVLGLVMLHSSPWRKKVPLLET